MNRRSSRRRTLWPIGVLVESNASFMLPMSRSSDRRRGLARLAELDRLDDVVVAGAAADVAVEALADLLLARLRVVGEQLHRRHHHARRAEAALQAVALAKRRLHRMQLAVLGEPFDRRDGAALHLRREHRARLDRAPVHVHGAGAALRGVATDVGAGQLQGLAQELDEQRARIDRPGDGLAVDGERNGDVHADLLRVGRERAPEMWRRCEKGLRPIVGRARTVARMLSLMGTTRFSDDVSTEEAWRRRLPWGARRRSF